MQGNQLVLVFTGKVADDAMTGNVKFGDFGEAPWTAKRKAAGAAATPAPAAAATTGSTQRPLAAATTAATAGASPASGTSIVNLPGNPLPFTAVLKQDGTAVTGTIAGPPRRAARHRHDDRQHPEARLLRAGRHGGHDDRRAGGNSLAGKTTIAGLGERTGRGSGPTESELRM